MKRILLLSIFLISTYSHSIEPYDYTIKVPNTGQTSFNGLQQGILLGERIKAAQANKEALKQEQELKARERLYKKELLDMYNDPSKFTQENLMKLMLAYPEFNKTTAQISEQLRSLESKK